MKIINNRQVSSKLSKAEQSILDNLTFKLTRVNYTKLGDKDPEFTECMKCFGGVNGGYSAKSIKSDIDKAREKFPKFTFNFSKDLFWVSLFIYDLSVDKWIELGSVRYEVDNFEFQDALRKYLDFPDK